MIFKSNKTNIQSSKLRLGMVICNSFNLFFYHIMTNHHLLELSIKMLNKLVKSCYAIIY